MIRYNLICDRQHEFESWFQNSDGYDKQVKRGLLTCPLCGSSKVEKAIMAPRLARAQAASASESEPAADSAKSESVNVPASAESPTPQERTPVAMISPQEQEIRQKLKEIRDHLIRHSDNVGQKFPEEARKIHYGETDHRSIYGEASAEEAKALADEGIPFHPLPMLPDDCN